MHSIFRAFLGVPDLLNFLDPWLVVFFLAILPVIELRGAILYGIGAGLDPFLVFLLSAAANSLIVFPVFLFLEIVSGYAERISFIHSFLEATREKTKVYVDKYGFIGLAVFVAIPLPGTGAYTAALGAHLLGMKKRKAIPAIILGVFGAAFIVIAFAIGLFSAVKLF